MDTQPKIPTLKDSQKPQVKVRGLEAGVTLFDRLKQFKKKDLAFILAGLGTLFMAPLAEHFMMSPETGDGTLQQGWGKGGAKGMFDGSGSSPYEPGTTGLAPGSAIGGGSDIITPLNVRDPSALVMGPGATQQPPTSSVMPPVAPPTAVATHSDSDLKDALAASARGVGAAAHAAKALLPIPKIALAGMGGLRGLGIVSGGTSAVAGGAPSSAGLVSGKAATGGGMAGVRAPSGFKGVARGTGGDTGGMVALKAAGDAAAGMFNKGSASSGLNDAANTAIPNGGSGLGGNGAGATGATDKPFGGDQNKDGKNVGESLAFLKQKAIQEAQIALWAKEQEAGDNKLEALKIRNTMAESIAGAVGTAVGAKVTCVISPEGDGCPAAPSSTKYFCNDVGGGVHAGAISGVMADVTKCTTNPSAKTAQGTKLFLCGNGNICVCPSPQPLYTGCKSSAGGDAAGTDAKNDPKKNIGDMNGSGVGSGAASDMGVAPVKEMKKSCDDIIKLQTGLNDAANADSKNAGSLRSAATAFEPFLKYAAGAVAVRDAVGSAGSGATPPDCKATALKLTSKDPLLTQLGNTSGAGLVGSLLASDKGILAQMDTQATATDAKGLDPVAKAAIGAADNIKVFVADVATVKKADDAVGHGSYDNAPDPLGLEGIKLTLNRISAGKGDTLTAEAKTAVQSLQKSAKTIHETVNNLDHAANTDLGPQEKPLRDSVTAGGSLPGVIARNGELDKAVAKVAAPLTKPVPANNENLTPKDPMTPGAMKGPLDAAKDQVAKTKIDVEAFPRLPKEQQTAKLKETQDEIDATGKAVRTLQADQKSIDDVVRGSANSAANWLKVGTTK